MHGWIEVDRNPPTTGVHRAIVVPFADGRCVLPLDASGRPRLVDWEAGRDVPTYLDAAFLVVLEQTGVRRQETYAFARKGTTVALAVHGELRDFAGGRLITTPEEAARALEDPELTWLCSRAHETLVTLTDERYRDDGTVLLETSYLAASTPEGGSGLGGDAEKWRLHRGYYVDALHRHGTYLDSCCANGLLMQTLTAWAAERGRTIEPHGLDISARLADEARRRLPHWADQIWVGDVFDWHPPMRFDFVTARLSCVREPRRRALVERLLERYPTPGGRVLIQDYGLNSDPDKESWYVPDFLREWGFAIAGELEADLGGGRIERVAYLES